MSTEENKKVVQRIYDELWNERKPEVRGAREPGEHLMKFLVIAHDRTDDEALVRRLVVRQRHLTAARRAVESGSMLIGGAILDDKGHMVGSMTVVSFPDRAALDEWLQNVPYMKNGIWERVEVYPYHVAVMARPDPDEREPYGNNEATPNPTPLGIGKER